MAASDITIYRDYPIVNGFVQVPPNLGSCKTNVPYIDYINSIPGSAEVSLSLGSGRNRGSKYGKQHFVRLPGINPDTWYS